VRARPPGQHDLARREDGHGLTVVALGAAEVRRVDELAGRGQLRQEGVVGAALVRAAGARKIGRVGLACEIDVALRVDGDVLDLVEVGRRAAAAEVARVGDHGVDDQRQVAAVASDGEPVRTAAVELEARPYIDPPPADDLVGDRRVLAQHAGAGADPQRAVARDAQLVDPAVAHTHAPDIRARPDDEVLLEPAVVHAQPHVDAAPRVALHDLPEARGRKPVAEEVHAAGQRLAALEGGRPRADQPLRELLEHQAARRRPHPVAPDREDVPIAVLDEADPRRGALTGRARLPRARARRGRSARAEGHWDGQCDRHRKRTPA
jgi:hypothetical protein